MTMTSAEHRDLAHRIDAHTTALTTVIGMLSAYLVAHDVMAPETLAGLLDTAKSAAGTVTGDPAPQVVEMIGTVARSTIAQPSDPA